MTTPPVPLNDGHAIPQIGLGTWPLDDAEAEHVVTMALDIGYRHVDTAVRYGNETGVGRGIAAAGVPRSQVFVTTKLDGPYQGDDKAVAGLDESLARLGLEYVDLLLIHWPLPAKDQYVSTWGTFERLQLTGKARSIGVSNFKPAHLRRLAAETGVVPAVNQIQVNPLIQRQDHVDYHLDNGIVTVSYTPLGRERAPLGKPVVVGIADRLGKTPAQVILRWHVQSGFVPIPKSANEERLRENLAVYDFELTREDMAAIATLDTGVGSDSDVKGH